MGTNIAKNDFKINLTMQFIMAISALILILSYNKIKNKYMIENKKLQIEKFVNGEELIIYSLLFTICVRSFIGLLSNFAWKSNFEMGLISVCAVVLGKMLGGILGDKFGFKKVSLISLLLSAVLFCFSFENMFFGNMAILFFNMTMPITLIVLSNILNSSKGFAFGLTTVALFIGAIPNFIGLDKFFMNEVVFLLFTMISAVVLNKGLIKYGELKNGK